MPWPGPGAEEGAMGQGLWQDQLPALWCPGSLSLLEGLASALVPALPQCHLGLMLSVSMNYPATIPGIAQVFFSFSQVSVDEKKTATKC